MSPILGRIIAARRAVGLGPGRCGQAGGHPGLPGPLGPGSAVRLVPGGRHTLRFRACLDALRRRLCSALEVTGRVESGVARNRTLPEDLPARSVAAGRRFLLAAHGGPGDRQGMLWQGEAGSPTVELEVP